MLAKPPFRADVDEDGLTLTLWVEGCPLPRSQWLTCTELSSAAQRAAAAVLYLAATGEAEERGEGVFLPHGVVANLDEATLNLLGLPGWLPLTVEVKHRGILSDPGFQLEVEYKDERGWQRFCGPRHGAFLWCGDELFTLPAPLFQALAEIDSFNAAPPAELTPRLEFVSRLSQLLASTATARLDDYLAGLVSICATAVALPMCIEADGTIVLEPILLRALPRQTAVDDSTGSKGEPPLELALTPAQHRVFLRQLRQRRQVPDRWPLGDGAYLLLNVHVKTILAEVKRLNALPLGERVQALREARSRLRRALAALTDEEFDSLLVDVETLSERVSHLGEWQGVAVPPRPPSGVKWLPSRVPIVLAGQLVQLLVAELPRLLEEVRTALRQGTPATVTAAGMELPVTEALAAALETIVETLGLEGGHLARGAGAPQPAPRRTLALHILDNIQAEVFRRALQPRRALDLDNLSGTHVMLPHQRAGLDWLARCWHAGLPGALLADDMGMGKTLQGLAFMGALRRQAETAGTQVSILVVAPTGLLTNWTAESRLHGFDRFLGEPLHASEVSASGPESFSAALRGANWVLVSYERLRNHHVVFAAHPWDVVVLDEAQRVKNPAALVTNAVKSLNAEFTLALTATPVENSFADLWCIVDAVVPGALGSLTSFLRWCEDPTHLEELPRRLCRPQNGVPPLLTRRLKHGTLHGLPHQEKLGIRKLMPEVQAAAYAREHQIRQLTAGREGVLAAIQRFRAVSLDPLPLEWQGNDQDYVASSARLQALVEILDGVCARGEKALVFVDTRHVQARLMAVLQRRYALPQPPLVINGEVTGRDRLARVEAFQQQPGFSVLLLSPRAGGVGLNIVAANHVIHLARWWNPAVEDQCTDRVYRIGQHRPVHVYYPLAIHPGLGEESFDARLDQLLTRKRHMAHQALAPIAPTAEELTDLIR